MGIDQARRERAPTGEMGQARPGYRIKRAIDVVLGSACLIVLSPLFAVIAIAVKANSPGPVFFRQHRLMRGRKVFTLLKFRTMVDGADGMLDQVFHLNVAQGPLFKAKHDPRATVVGRFLRRTFLDELPQLVNVVRGEMSLVGPRPCLLEEAASLDGELNFRFTVPQGLTGPWQVSGRHALTFEQQLQVEREYIESWSLRADARILIRTVPLVLRAHGG